MAKKKNRASKNINQNKQPSSAELTPSPLEPTNEQVERLTKAEVKWGAFDAKHGVPQGVAPPEPILPTLEECLLRAEKLLSNARKHYENASAKEEKAKYELERTSAQEQEFMSRVEEHEQHKAKIQEKEKQLQSKETDLLELASSLKQREWNAEQGFLAEKAKILEPVEAELAQLRNKYEELEASIAKRKEQAEEDARSLATERAAKWAKEDEERTSQQHEKQVQFLDEMAKVRQTKLADLHDELKKQREKDEAEWNAILEARQKVLNERENDLEHRALELEEQAQEQRKTKRKLQAEREILEEDQQAIEQKVERLTGERKERIRHKIQSLEKERDDARELRDAYFQELASRKELDRRFGDRRPDEIMAYLDQLERERDNLADQLRKRPDTGAAERLDDLEKERSQWLEERAVLQGDLARANGELASRRLAAIELEALRKQKEVLEVHKQLLGGAVDELRVSVDELTRQEDHRNPMMALTSLDSNEDLQSESYVSTPFGRKTLTLQTFAEDLRHRIAVGVPGRTLFYTERDVRAFLGGLAMSRLMLLQGISGTGKTSLPMAFASAIGGGIEIVEVQAGWRDRQDLIGYYNAFHRHYYATNFLQALYKAATPAYKDRLFMMVLDEINLSRPEQFFADFLSALEQPLEKRRLTLVNDPVSSPPRLMYEGRHLPIPPNVWFVGTANHDETTAEFADKTYDRAHVMEMPRKTEAAHFNIRERGQRNPISFYDLEEAFAEAVKSRAAEVRKAIGWLRDASFVNSLEKKFQVGWGNRLENQLSRYLPVVVESGGSLGEAMDHLLVTKVLRKLKDRHDVRATALEELAEELQTSWDKLDNVNPPERCVALIESEIAVKKGEELL